MVCKLTDEDRRNLLVLISRSTTTIPANEVMAVAVLQQKLQAGMPEADADGAKPSPKAQKAG